MLKVGIVGLPNVGKSTLFNALLKKHVALVANYPFATIEPNIGVIAVPDGRLEKLADVIQGDLSVAPLHRDNIGKTQRPPIVPSAVEFYDIAGLVKGASEGEGLGNKFLSHIRETALIAHVVRLFEDSDITHVDNEIDPIKDIQTIETELILADLAVLDKQKEPKGKVSKEDGFAWETIQYAKKHLDAGSPLRHLEVSKEQKEALKQFCLLSGKPVLYVFNVSEKQLENTEETRKKINVILGTSKSTGRDPGQARMTTSSEHSNTIFLCAKLEQELVALDETDQQEYLQQFNLEQPGLNRLIITAYEHLGLISFLTAGEKEVRAWPIENGTLAPQAAGTIHTDFEKHFIKAEIAQFDMFVELGGWTASRNAGKVTLGGKDYVMKDGDVVDFKVNV